MSESAIEILFRAHHTRIARDLPPMIYAEDGIIACPPAEGPEELAAYLRQGLTLPLIAHNNFVIALETFTSPAGDPEAPKRETVLFALFDSRHWTETWLADVHPEPGDHRAHLGPARSIEVLAPDFDIGIDRFAQEFLVPPTRAPEMEIFVTHSLMARGFHIVWGAPYDGPTDTKEDGE